MSSKNLDKLLAEALAIEAEEAREAGGLGFMAQALVQATMPHKKTPGNELVRTNGVHTLTMLAPSKVGLPYGSIPRLLLAWLTTEAVQTNSRELMMGHSLSEFMQQLDLVPTGGRWGTITRLKDQTRRLFSAFVYCNYLNTDPKTGAQQEAMRKFMVVENDNLWWEPKDPHQKSLFKSTVTLSQPFFEEIITNPIPIDMRALKALKRSPMALDIYTWLTYRLSYLRKPTEIPWQALQTQFGADYKRDAHGLRNFKQAFLHHLTKVLLVYPQARVNDGDHGLLLRPSQPHVKPMIKK